MLHGQPQVTFAIEEQLRDTFTVQSWRALSKSLKANPIEANHAAKRSQPKITVTSLRNGCDCIARQTLLDLPHINREIRQRGGGLAGQFRLMVRCPVEGRGDE